MPNRSGSSGHYRKWWFRIVRLQFVLKSLANAPRAPAFETFLKDAGDVVAWIARFRLRPQSSDVVGEGFAIYDRSFWDEQAEHDLFRAREIDGIKVIFKKNDVASTWDWMTYNRSVCFWPSLKLGATHLNENNSRLTLPVVLPNAIPRLWQPTAEEAQVQRASQIKASRICLTEDDISRILDEDNDDEDDISEISFSDSTVFIQDWPISSDLKVEKNENIVTKK